ncbi:cyclic nucleotide-binding domain-containing protein [bacterium]|nr:cyclic nucleotide-binding domain-containing protein [bacterium]
MNLTSELKNIVILNKMSNSVLSQLEPHITLIKYKEDEVVFDEKDKAEKFYMLKQGKILLQKRISSKVTISMGAIKPGYSFGWSAIIAREPFSMMAKCAEDSDVFTIDGKRLLEVFENDKPMGYLFMQHLNRMMKNRLDRWEDQLLRSLRDHPDFCGLIED